MKCGPIRGVGTGGGGSDGANFIHFLYKVKGKKSVQKKAFLKNNN